MRALVSMLLTLVSLAFAPAPVYRPKPDTRTDLEKMQGDWVLVYAHKNGVREEVTRQVVWTINGDCIIATLDGKKCSTTYFELDGRTTPRSIDLLNKRDGVKSVPGWFSVDNDTLKFCRDEERPADLSGFGTSNGVWVFDRKKR
jgi:uncharacterized protein (TIGR03067 family)